MAYTTDQTAAGDGQPTTARLRSLQQKVAMFFPSAVPQQLDALESFLTKPLRMETISGIIPPAEEARIRLDLARKLQDRIREQLQTDDWKLTACHLSTLFVMPRDILEEFANSGVTSTHDFGWITLQRTSDLVRECKLSNFKSFSRLITDDVTSHLPCVFGKGCASYLGSRKLSRHQIGQDELRSRRQPGNNRDGTLGGTLGGQGYSSQQEGGSEGMYSLSSMVKHVLIIV